MSNKHSWTHQSRNPVSSRLYKVLGTNFNDDATREALRTLSELYAPTFSGKGQDGKRDIDENDEDVEEEEITSGTPSFGQDNVLSEAIPGESAAKARKHLRRDMEKKLTEGSRQFLKAFGDVDQVCLSHPLIHTTLIHPYILFV